MGWIVAGLIGIAIGAFVLGAEVMLYFIRRDRFSRLTLGCGVLGVLLSMSGIIDSLATPTGFV